MTLFMKLEAFKRCLVTLGIFQVELQGKPIKVQKIAKI